MEQIASFIDQYEESLKNINRIDAQISKLEEEFEFADKCVNLITLFIEKYFNDGIDVINDYITGLLKPQFGMDFKLLIDKNSKNVIVKTLVKEDGVSEYHSLLNSNGGGVLDFVSMMLRLLFIMKTQNMKIFIVDEAFKNISHGHRSVMLNYIKTLVYQLDIQIIMVTHESEYVEFGDKVYVVGALPAKMIDVIQTHENVNYAKQGV